MAVITPTAIVIISTLMLMVLKRIRLWISAIIFTLCSAMRIRQIKDWDEFLLFLRERVNSMHSFLSKPCEVKESQRMQARPYKRKFANKSRSIGQRTQKQTAQWRQVPPMRVHPCFDRNIRYIYTSSNKFWHIAKAHGMESIVCRIHTAKSVEWRFSSIKRRLSLLRWL